MGRRDIGRSCDLQLGQCAFPSSLPLSSTPDPLLCWGVVVCSTGGEDDGSDDDDDDDDEGNEQAGEEASLAAVHSTPFPFSHVTPCAVAACEKPRTPAFYSLPSFSSLFLLFAPPRRQQARRAQTWQQLRGGQLEVRSTTGRGRHRVQQGCRELRPLVGLPLLAP